ncbi:MAG TPA: hypothetical protein EYN32_06385 [Phycisphaerales bacterium]|nr:hypothetical protein [Phycisphaerales bacterium]
MRNYTTILTFTSTLIFLACFGCNNEADSTAVTPPSPAPAPAPVTTTVETPEEDTLKIDSNQQYKQTITLAGITLEVTVQGTIAPNAMLDVSILQTAGGHASAIRLWVGDESGVGSIKTKTHSHGAASHAHVQAPAKLPVGSAVWVEVQTPSGEKESGKIE